MAKTGNMSEMRGLLVVLGFISSFVILVAMIPNQFLYATTMQNMTVPNNYSASDFTLGLYNETWPLSGPYQMNENSSYSGYTEHFGYPVGDVFIVKDIGHDVGGDFYKFGGHDLDLWYSPANSSSPTISLHHNYAATGWFFGIAGFPTAHAMTWENKAKTNRGLSLNISSLETDYAANELPYKVSCEHLYLYANFWYDPANWTTVTEAYNHHELYVSLGIDFDQTAAGFSAWDLIARLITFQSIEGVPFPINYLISLILWIASAYVIVIMVLRFIWPGSGGA